MRQIRQGLGQGVTPAQLHVAVGADQQDARSRQLPRQELHQQQRRLVRPVQVVEDEDQRLLPGRVLEEVGEAVEEAEARLFGRQLGGAGWSPGSRSRTSETTSAMTGAPPPISESSAAGSRSRT